MKIRKELWFGFVLMALIVAAAIGMLGNAILSDSIVSIPSPAAITSTATPKRTACPRRSPIARLGVSIGALPEPFGASQVRCAPV